jgi:hypothetical protein
MAAGCFHQMAAGCFHPSWMAGKAAMFLQSLMHRRFHSWFPTRLFGQLKGKVIQG